MNDETAFIPPELSLCTDVMSSAFALKQSSRVAASMRDKSNVAGQPLVCSQ